MDNGRIYGGPGSDMIALLQNSNNSLWFPSTLSFHETTMVNLDEEAQQGRRPISPKRDHGGFSTAAGDGEDAGGEEFEINNFFNHPPEKKRRLTHEQVEYLERNFEVENKLEPERKIKLAKEVGLQPRQVAIWFQNRRARFKTKQLEKDYDSLKASYDRLKVDCDSLTKERDTLQNQVMLLTKRLNQRSEERKENPVPFDPLHYSNRTIPQVETKTGHETGLVAVVPSMKQVEEASSAKSDVFDSEDPDQPSDYSQDEDGPLMMSESLLLTPPTLPPDDSLLDDDQPFWSWLS